MLIDNTLFLRERFPEIRHYFRQNEDQLKRDHIAILDSKKGPKTMRIKTDNLKELMIHSLYDPMREAERIISTHKDKINKDTHVFFYGVGLGYHIEKFHELFPTNSYSVYEPVPEIFLEMSNEKLLNQIITNKTRNLYIDNHNIQVSDYLNEFNTSNRNIHLIILPSYENIVRDKLDQFRSDVKDTIRNRRTSLHTSLNFQKRWVMNSIINFKEVLNTPNMLIDINSEQFKGKPAIIVSAGPSLAQDIEYLRYIKENNLAHIFSVGSAINSLIKFNIIPDAVCTYDPKERNYKVFNKMIENEITSIPMIYGSSVGYETLYKYKGPKVNFITSQDKTSIYFLKDQLALDRYLINDSPSIAVMIFQLLNKLEASPIIFMGQNLGFLHGRRFSEGIEYSHISSTVDESQLEKAPTVKDVHGNEIKTTLSFNSMREAIEAYAKLYGGDYINTTKGGADIEGAPFESIENVLNKTLTKPIKKEQWWIRQNQINQIGIKNKYNNLISSQKQFTNLMLQFESILDSIVINIKSKNKSNVNRLLLQFDNSYNTLSENIYYRYFLSFYIRIQVELLSNEIKELNRDLDIFVKADKIYTIFTEFMSYCQKESEELVKIINSAFNELLDN